MGMIPTVKALRHRNIPVADVSCLFCGDAEESVDHLFTGCMVAKVLWQHIASWCKVQNWFAFSFKDLMEVHNFVGLSGRVRDIFYGIIIIGCWSIWRARNRLKFQSKKDRMEDIIGEVKVLGFLWAKNRAKLSSLSWGDWCLRNVKTSANGLAGLSTDERRFTDTDGTTSSVVRRLCFLRFGDEQGTRWFGAHLCFKLSHLIKLFSLWLVFITQTAFAVKKQQGFKTNVTRDQGCDHVHDHESLYANRVSVFRTRISTIYSHHAQCELTAI
ncbi:toll/interleukin-1 receptor (TIR) domain-containing protein [Artemisia annua]|uniref:Toll/interleukin-1 receptor (TIR) domain-containing protein n=1 Tax=Artemisia annua TaxID=35608 RepID=A0A2U1L4D9_ARTAN|nr:toll/interleukin-1 receptor (TIR) domain-containing protein [Artemisia annua]